ncbi:penicillin-binding transpeptidase domain-containing protein [Bacillus solitudinis]|uniref:penicillin-binding transpeptidase domain-containing protein n=1 Tax=Bacillus solitudinis TaxID=2014074 RepID=UPI000C2458F6|nr:penicillin-binding transpeptidase domain-containing protein [Bacillus solitudinis]
MDIKRATTNVRAVILMVMFLLLFLVLTFRIGYIQTSKEVRGEELVTIAEEKWTKSQVIEGKRGTIYDRKGSALAQELNSYTVYAVLDKNQVRYVKNPRETAELLSPYIDMDVTSLENLLSADRFQVELGASAKNLTYDKMLEIKNLELDGIYFRQEPRRYYPKQTYASHIIGYTERNMEKARMGLEKSYDDLLRPTNGTIQYQSDRKGIPLPNPNSHVTPAINGHDIYLTLDSNIQTALEQVMTKVEDQYSPEKIIAIVADPKTGQILAMSNRPSFNPNHYEQIKNYMNYAISDRFEPGSTMKMFTLAAAIEEDVYNGQEEYQSGQYKIGPDTVSDHNKGRGWGPITYDEGLLRSSNVAFSKIALEKLGPEELYNYLNRFGFNQPTGIDLPNEATSLIANSYKYDAAATAFGQATAVTPIQQIQAVTAIANNGTMMKPYIIDRVEDSETKEVIEKHDPEEVGKPISAQTAAEVRNLLGRVVSDPSGTGRPYALEGFQVAGKTGTAQVRNPEGRGYIRGHGENIFSFLGMAPKDDPSVVVYVAVERPQLSKHEVGSEPTAMIFNTIMKQSLQYLNIMPSIEELTEEAETGFKTMDYVNRSVADVRTELEKAGLEVYVFGDGENIEAQQPFPNKGLLPGEKVMLRTKSNTYQMPNIIGWSNRDVLKLTNLLNLNPTLFGNGFVTTQSIQEGATIQKDDYLIAEFSNNRNQSEKIEEQEDSGTVEQIGE